jgi:hypothetical protein
MSENSNLFQILAKESSKEARKYEYKSNSLLGIIQNYWFVKLFLSLLLALITTLDIIKNFLNDLVDNFYPPLAVESLQNEIQNLINSPANLLNFSKYKDILDQTNQIFQVILNNQDVLVNNYLFKNLLTGGILDFPVGILGLVFRTLLVYILLTLILFILTLSSKNKGYHKLQNQLLKLKLYQKLYPELLDLQIGTLDIVNKYTKNNLEVISLIHEVENLQKNLNQNNEEKNLIQAINLMDKLKQPIEENEKLKN